MEFILALFTVVAAVLFAALIINRCPDCFGRWKYPGNKNPFRRTCKKCGRQEDFHDDGFRGVWEPMNRETPTKRPKP